MTMTRTRTKKKPPACWCEANPYLATCRQQGSFRQQFRCYTANYDNLPFAIKMRRRDIRPNLTFLFNYLNDRYFYGAIREFSARYLPNMFRSYGYTSKQERLINISWTLHRALRHECFATLMGTLLHEMCHAYLYLYHTGMAADKENEAHGASFQRLLNYIEMTAKTLGHRYHLRIEPPNAAKDIEKIRRQFTWQCRSCGEVQETLVTRDINGDGVLSRHRGCHRRDNWVRCG